VNEAEREADKQERLVTLLSRSPTRQQLVRLLLEGKSRKAIAAAMKRSQHTIDAHLKVIYRTVGVGDRAQLMLLARDLVRKAVPPGTGESPHS
jgi:DNA-binding NarL/FixJ family response regulator